MSIAVAQLSSFVEHPGQKNWDSGIRGTVPVETKNIDITYDGRELTELVAYLDADRPTTVATDAL